MQLFPPANEVCEGYVFTGVCPGGGVCATWQGGMHSRDACMAGGRWVCMVGGGVHGGGHVWQGGMHGGVDMCGGGVHATADTVLSLGYVYFNRKNNGGIWFA